VELVKRTFELKADNPKVGLSVNDLIELLDSLKITNESCELRAVVTMSGRVKSIRVIVDE